MAEVSHDVLLATLDEARAVQALVQAGAQPVLVSLWPVYAATALLMTRFYQNLLGRREGLKAPLGKAEALAEAKQWLRGLPRAEGLGPCREAVPGRAARRRQPPQAGGAGGHGGQGGPAVRASLLWSAFVLLGDPD
jgi:CHAT domain-containing protein